VGREQVIEPTTGPGKVCVLGGGSWGTALAGHLALQGRDVSLWVHDADLATRMKETRVNATYLPEFPIPEKLEITSSLEAAGTGVGWVLVAVPTRHCREVVSRLKPFLALPVIYIVASKGIEQGTLLRSSQACAQAAGETVAGGLVVLSGPSFAREVAAGKPTLVVAASEDAANAEKTQALLAGARLRVYSSPDPLGVEIGGALKNVVAIAAGVVHGLEMGPNTLAALITRGLAEISRLALAMGGRRETLAGLAGVGDLVLTCTGSQSRNFQVGLELGRGRKLDEILARMKMVAEGVNTARSVAALSEKHGVSMPIAQAVSQVLFESKSPEEAIVDLLNRPQRPEQD
jgi:glycerol-3-phosphate dehydrogenase (NAD(P)+)